VTASAELFRTVFGTDAAGVWAAPGRVNLIGEHTDYNGGLVLPFALAERTEAAIALRADRTIRIWSAQLPDRVVEISADELAPGRPGGWAAYVAGVPWALETDRGFDIAVDSSVPMGSGLSSSAALLCAVALGIDELLGLDLSRRELARRTRATENGYVGAPTGGMDQIASLLCTAGHALLYDVRADTTEQVPFDPATAGLEILVVDTNVRHGHADGAYALRRDECERAARLLGVESLRDIGSSDWASAASGLGDAVLERRVRHVVSENQRVLGTVGALRRGDWAMVGGLLGAAHRSIRDDFEASCAELDAAVEALEHAGAVGARMTGGGFGGAALSLVSAEHVDQARREVADEFVRLGFAPPSQFSVAPSGGACRIE
jgi:galactokinase